MRTSFKQFLSLIPILILGIIFRFNHLNWDDNFHLHPDERFLTMVAGVMKFPVNWLDYFNSAISFLNPVNIGYRFFVYGVFPLILNKVMAIHLGNDSYNAFTLQGRILSSLVDLMIVVLVFKTIFLIEKKYRLDKSLKYWASFFYAISVLPIQLSHFFTVDTFLNFFMFASFYFSLKFSYQKKWKNLFFGAVFLGLGMASKITALFILPLNLILIILPVMLNLLASLRSGFQHPIKNNRIPNHVRDDIFKTILIVLLYLLTCYLTLRIADPYLFENVNFLDPRPSTLFLENIKTLKSFDSTNVWYPPGVQWISKPKILFSLINLAVFGVGIPYFILILFGIFRFFKKLNRIKELKIVLLWVVSFFLYQSFQFAQTMRYFIFLYPFLAIFGAFGVKKLFSVIASVSMSLRAKRSNLSANSAKQSHILKLRLLRRFTPRNDNFNYNVLRSTFNVLFILLLLIWPIMFSSIYLHKNSRVEASEWIYKNVPNGTSILSEHWDDALPLPMTTDFSKQYNGAQLPVFDQDTQDKWKVMNNLLNKADYYILSSNRGWGSITTVPQKYPLMNKFYKDLFASSCHPERRKVKRSEGEGSVCFKKIKEFTSYPKLEIGNWKLEIDDHWADESFTVYDHPQVFVFKKETATPR